MPLKSPSPSAEILALKALSFLGNSEDHLLRFLAMAGMQPDELMARVEEAGVQSAILDFLLSDDALLLDFCESESVQPKEVHRAKFQLDGSEGC